MSWLVSEVPDVIEVDDLTVRRYSISDAATLVGAVTASLPELMEWMPWAKFEPQTVAQREALIATWLQEWREGANFTMGIFRDCVCVGGTGLHLRGDVGEIEIGYWVTTSHTKQGIATRVSKALVDVAFEMNEVTSVTISHDIANIASQRIPEQLGFSVLREYEREPEAAGETGFVRVWTMTKKEWLTR